jgi:membrane protease YdiL (CAAX protease family)
LQPKLTTLLGLRQGILATGIIWAVWHYIFIFFGNYYDADNIFIDTALFTITIVLMSFSIGWIRWASKSVWPCVIFHSA